MKTPVLIFCVLIASAVTAKRSEFIIGGNDAELGQFPHMVSIRMQQPESSEIFHGCGGAIVNRNWVLTAGHCLVLGWEQFIIVGAVRLQDAGERYEILRVIPHPEFVFGATSNWHDIGLLKTNDIQFNQLVQPIPLGRRNIIRSRPAVMSGFGHSSMDLENVQPTDRLQYKNTTVLTNFDCAVRTAIAGIFVPEYQPTIYPGHICTLVRRGVGGCYHDSGSPLISDGAVIGVVTSGLSCARGAPDLLTRVSHYLRWLEAQMIE